MMRSMALQDGRTRSSPWLPDLDMLRSMSYSDEVDRAVQRACVPPLSSTGLRYVAEAVHHSLRSLAADFQTAPLLHAESARCRVLIVRGLVAVRSRLLWRANNFWLGRVRA